MTRSVATSLPIIALLALLVLAVGCGTDPVRADLEIYHTQVIGPLAAEESKTIDEVRNLPALVKSNPDSMPAILSLYEGTLLPRYRSILGAAEKVPLTTPEVREVNRKLVGRYGELVAQLEKCVVAIKARDRGKFEETRKAIAKIDFDSVKAQLRELAEKHGALAPGS